MFHGVLSRWLGFPAAGLANGVEARRHYEAGELLRGRMWKCSLCGPYSLPLSLPQFTFLKGKPSGTRLTVACAPGGVRRSVCGQIFHKFSINSCTSGPNVSPMFFPNLVFLGPRSLWRSLRQSTFLRGKERGEKKTREKRGLFSRTGS